MTVSDQQLLDTVRKATWSQMHHGIEDSEGWRHSAECEACATLTALAERLTDLREENETCIEERDLFYDRLTDLRAENNLFDERGRKLAEMTSRAMVAEKAAEKATEIGLKTAERLANATELLAFVLGHDEKSQPRWGLGAGQDWAGWHAAKEVVRSALARLAAPQKEEGDA